MPYTMFLKKGYNTKENVMILQNDLDMNTIVDMGQKRWRTLL